MHSFTDNATQNRHTIHDMTNSQHLAFYPPEQAIATSTFFQILLTHQCDDAMYFPLTDIKQLNQSRGCMSQHCRDCRDCRETCVGKVAQAVASERASRSPCERGTFLRIGLSWAHRKICATAGATAAHVPVNADPSLLPPPLLPSSPLPLYPSTPTPLYPFPLSYTYLPAPPSSIIIIPSILHTPYSILHTPYSILPSHHSLLAPLYPLPLTPHPSAPLHGLSLSLSPSLSPSLPLSLPLALSHSHSHSQ